MASMAGSAQKQASRDLSLFAVPKPLKKQEEAEGRARELQLETVRTINGMLDLARRHERDLPRIDEDNFSINSSNRNATVVQSGGVIVAVDMRGAISVYWAGRKVTLG
ncbi:MAG: hypothetical protein PHQ80_03525 [Candidatus ainarchaeum sp.]|nr:hypothetical protein [Candidatus ainarchaeum sp.]MDD5096381.1 hypothetical protein [Candidatus ainarchaeum sp.]